jgi:hypothetical protein
MPDPSKSTLFVYSRRGCHLCDILLEELLVLVRGRLDVEVRDIDSCEEWQRRFNVRIPVVEIDGEILCEHRLNRPALDAVLARQGVANGGQ